MSTWQKYTKYIKNINEYINPQKLGTTGNTYLVEHNESHKRYVSRTYEELVTDQDQQSFFNEITFRITEQYPELMPIKALNLKDYNGENHPTILSYYMEKGSLEDNFNVLTKTQKYIIINSIANCCDFLHKCEVFHLNLNPNNILLDPQYYPRITDYYGFKIHKLIEKIDNKIGLSLYMAPEVIHEKKFGPEADVYSFGIIAYEILTNDRSFTNMVKKYESFDDIPQNILPNLSLIKNDHLRSIVMKCLSLDPKERPTFPDIIESLNDKLIKKDMKVEHRDLQKYINFQSLERAKLKDPVAMNRIGCIRDYEKADIKEILKYYDGAIEQGNGSAMFNKVGMLYFGRNCQRNVEEAMKLMKLAIKHNNPFAMTNYGCFLFFGVDVPRDTEEGLYYLKTGVKANNSYAMLELGKIYLNGFSVPTNTDKALQLFEKSASLQNAGAMVCLAQMYKNGNGVQKDINVAIKWLKEAIDLYSNEAKCVLADIYAYEDGFKNEEEALRLLDEAIEDNYTKAVIKKHNLIFHDNKKDADEDLIDVCYIDFFDGLHIEKPKSHHIKYLPKSDFQNSSH